MTDAHAIRILLADDHRVVRQGLRLVLDGQADLRVVAEAADGVEALTRGLLPDVDLAVLDITMPRMSGLETARELTRRRPDVKVVILSMHDNRQYFFEALKAGASGYVLKSAADQDLVEACRAAMRGEPFIYPAAAAALVRNRLADAEAPDCPLTAREQEIVALVAEALSSRQIAERLSISIKTVDRHRANIMQKLGMSDRVELTRYAIRRGLVEA